MAGNPRVADKEKAHRGEPSMRSEYAHKGKPTADSMQGLGPIFLHSTLASHEGD